MVPLRIELISIVGVYFISFPRQNENWTAGVEWESEDLEAEEEQDPWFI